MKEILPQGDLIRQLLTKSNISKAKINSFLREKGVFLGHKEKDNSVPLLMKTVISPRDFRELYETQKEKEDETKYRTATIKCDSDFKLAEVFNRTVNLNELIKEKHRYEPNYKVIGDPAFYFEDEKTAVLEFEIERQNLLKDWDSNKTKHKGSLVLKKSSENEIQVSIQQNFTSKETLEVNKLLMSNLKNQLKDKDIISSDNALVSILFNDFSNFNRIQFLYKFINFKNIYLDFKSISDIILYPDENISTPKELEDFLREIDNLKLSGKELQRHMLLSKKKYFPKLIFASLSLTYKLNYHGLKGNAILEIGFPDYIKDKNEKVEFQISLKLKFPNIKRPNSEDEIKKKLLGILEKQKLEAYEEYGKS